MATERSFVAYVVEQAQLGDALSVKAMFGEYGVYLDGRMVALLCDNSLFVKTTPATDALTAALPRRAPYPGAKPYAVADEVLDDADALRSLLQATAREVPQPTPKSTSKRPVRDTPKPKAARLKRAARLRPKDA